jgi:hypothetical protein
MSWSRIAVVAINHATRRKAGGATHDGRFCFRLVRWAIGWNARMLLSLRREKFSSVVEAASSAVHKTSKNWLDCDRAKFYSVPSFGKLLATLANPVAGPQTIHRAARVVASSPKFFAFSQPARLTPVTHPTLHILTEVRKPLD